MITVQDNYLLNQENKLVVMRSNVQIKLFYEVKVRYACQIWQLHHTAQIPKIYFNYLTLFVCCK